MLLENNALRGFDLILKNAQSEITQRERQKKKKRDCDQDLIVVNNTV